MRVVWWVSCVIIFWTGLFSGAFITSRAQLFIDNIATWVAALSAMIAGYVAWLTYCQHAEAKRQRRWEHFKPLLVVVLRSSQQISTDAKSMAGVGVMGEPQEEIQSWLKGKIKAATDEMEPALVELRDVWGDFLPNEYYELLNDYSKVSLELRLKHTTLDGRFHHSKYYNGLSQVMAALFSKTKEVTREFSGLHEKRNESQAGS
ncbi:hypothetical protein [Halodesulfovibrio marinisediminis]|uniref:Uncharacterized protein n=1 Tax=Halodesulfovibrio marinisediminis DSM 17456 TaxID=1121457 RepID=A0A1N6DNL4_9BACT|nr:hypothetical protein [Halodesulfovibrio marinisediminis]SIN72398.1 hypothetical protein SAMN02745161_0349 [Halodesulfovibrio marinisediminis DSM 17456]